MFHCFCVLIMHLTNTFKNYSQIKIFLLQTQAVSRGTPIDFIRSIIPKDNFKKSPRLEGWRKL